VKAAFLSNREGSFFVLCDLRNVVAGVSGVASVSGVTGTGFPSTPAPVVELLVVSLSLLHFALVLYLPYVHCPGSLGEVLYVQALVLAGTVPSQ